MKKLTIDIDHNMINDIFYCDYDTAEEILSEVLSEEGDIREAIEDFLIERYIDRVEA